MKLIASAAATLLLATVMSGCALRPEWTRSDHGRAQDRRQEVVDLIAAGKITEVGRYPDELVLPKEYADLATDGIVEVGEGYYFFMTWTGFSPDPYCGYEYAPDAATVSEDPLGSGGGTAESTGNGWYWICAR
jgi:hypothetical protein